MGGDEKHKQLATLAAKLSLHNAQEIRPLIAAAGSTIIFPEGQFKHVLEATKTCGKNYSERARLQTGGKSSEGPPHVHIYASMVLSILDMAPAAVKPVSQTHVDTVADPRTLTLVVERCQLSSCREGGKMKFRLHLVDLAEYTMKKVQTLLVRSTKGEMIEATVEEVMCSAEAGGPLPSQILRATGKVFNAHGGEVAEGMAPRGVFEREIQKMLDEMTPPSG